MATITQWTFEGDVITPSTGTGTASLVGGATASFATGNGGGRAWNTTTYPAQGTGNKTRGVQFTVPTTGFQDIQVSFDLRHSNTAANTVVFQYSTDGSSFIDSMTFRAAAGDTFFTRSVNLSAITGLNNNPNTAFRILSAFDPPDTGTSFVAANPSSTYSTGGTMRYDNVTITGNAISTPSPTPTPAPPPPDPSNPSFLRQIGVFSSANGAEIPAFDPASKRLFVVAGNVVEIIDLSNPANPTLIGTLPFNGFPAFGFSFVPNSVAVKNGIVAVAIAEVDAQNNHNPGQVQFFNASNGQFLKSVTVGFLPDDVKFSPDGTKVLVANEGEPNEAYTVDPEGSISIIDISNGVLNATEVKATFTSFNSQRNALIAQGVRIFGRIDTNNDGIPDTPSTVAQDLEPEYIAFSGDGQTAWVTLQENNAVAVVNIPTATVTSILPLGIKDHSVLGNGLDASDRDVDGTASGGGKINIQNWPIFGVFQPDAIASFVVGGQTFYITANEGDSRVRPTANGIVPSRSEGDIFNEEVTLGFLIDNSLLDLDNNGIPDTNSTVVPNSGGQTLGTLRLAQNLGRLSFTRASGDTDGDGLIEQLTTFGARSFSIFNSFGSLIYDSGDDFEQITARDLPANFNSNNSSNNFDNRSDNKGPEPEGVVTATIDGQVYAFIGLERIGGVMVYNVTDPQNPQFVQYFNNRSFTIPPTSGLNNSGPEGLTFIPAADSPNGVPLLVVANEISKTVQILQVGLRPIHQIQGTGLTSPLVGQTVTIEGIVVGDFQGAGKIGGFFVQEEDSDADNNPLTSEGIQVFLPSTSPLNSIATVGDKVRVTGVVSEFGTAPNTITQLSSVSNLQVISSGNPLPTPAIVDLPVANITDLERFEGMRVTFPETLTVSETFTLARFGEILLSADGRRFQPTEFIDPNDNPASGTSFSGNSNVAAVTAQQDLNIRRSITLDDGLTTQNPSTIPYLNAQNTRRIGDTVTGLTGVLDQRFPSATNPNGYRIQPTGPVNFVDANPRPINPPNVGNANVKVGSFNLLNYFTTLNQPGNFTGPGNNLAPRGAQNATEFNRQREKTATTIAQLNADILGLIELENNGTTAIADLVNAVNTKLGSNVYSFIPDPVGYTSVPGGDDAIKVGFIYKPTVVTPIGAALTTSDSSFLNSGRAPVAQTFRVNSNGAVFTPIINHFKSKGGGSTATGANIDQGDGQGAFNAQRVLQAQAVINFVNNVVIPTSGDPDVLVLGDLNAYGQEDPVDLFRANGFVDLIDLFDGDNISYSFVFQGQSGRLDHALATPSLVSQVTGASEWHINADEPIFLDYNLNFRQTPPNNLGFDNGNTPDFFDPTNPFRTSDHDPVLVGLNLTAPVTGTSRNLGAGNLFQGTNNSDTLVGTDGRDTIVGFGGNDFISAGDGNDSIDGGTGDDFIFGGDGNDTILGGTGNDTIVGGNGADTLFGGAGSDIFLFNSATEFGDVIRDFQDGADLLGINRAVANSFADLTVIQQGSSTIVRIGSSTIATLTNFGASSFTAADVVFF